MCLTCGCSGDGAVISNENGTHTHILPDGTVITHEHEHAHSHEHTHSHSHEHEHAHSHEHTHSHDHSHAHSHDHEHTHSHNHEHTHSHSHDHGHSQEHTPENHLLHAHAHGRGGDQQTLILEQQIMAKNDSLASRNREWFDAHQILALNMMSSPGSGKTTLLEHTLKKLASKVAVIEGDQETSFDAERIRATGAPTIQVNTGTGCHLEADMIWHSLDRLNLSDDTVLFIENVGNLVCPSLFDLGETERVVLMSTTEGEDKPLKYPHMFRSASLVLLTKIDLLPYLDFDLQRAFEAVHAVNPDVQILQVSTKSGEGMQAWYDWIEQHPSRQKVAST